MIRIVLDLPSASARHCGGCPLLTGGAADRATRCHVFGTLQREHSPGDVVDPLLRADACRNAETFGGLNVVALPMLGPDEDDGPPSTQPAPSAELTSDELPELVVPPPQGTNGSHSVRESER